jgi:hypothetical protein
MRSTDFAEPRLTVTVAKALVTRAPIHAAQASGWWRRELGIEKEDSSDAKDIGRLFHSVLFFGWERTAVVSDADMRTKEGKELRAGTTLPIVKTAVASKIDAMVAAVKPCLPAFIPEDCETHLEWEEEDDLGRPTKCFGAADIVIDSPAGIIDIKTCADANPRALAAKHIEYGYDIQAVAYSNALDLDPYDFAFVHVESSAPYAVSVIRHDTMMVHHGQMRWARAKRLWNTLCHTRNFEGYGNARINPPPWAMKALLDAEEANG